MKDHNSIYQTSHHVFQSLNSNEKHTAPANFYHFIIIHCEKYYLVVFCTEFFLQTHSEHTANWQKENSFKRKSPK